MAETLGSLIDKLTIKNIRSAFLKSGRYEVEKRGEKIRIIEGQRKDLIDEIDRFLYHAVRGEIRLKDLKIKLYNKPVKYGGTVEKLGSLADKLARKNMELWALEDEVRRSDVSDAVIVRTKRAIDLANQERNDLIDGIDTLLEKTVKKKRTK